MVADLVVAAGAAFRFPSAADAASAATLQATFRETSQTTAMRNMDDRSQVTLMCCRHPPIQAASAMAARGTEKVVPRICQTLTAKAAIRKTVSIHSAALPPLS